MKTQVKKAHDSFMKLLYAADLDPGHQSLLLKAWDSVMKAVASGDTRRIRKSIDNFCRAISKHVE